MEFSLEHLQPKERASFALRSLYETAGCRKYHMGRFEEYSLYQENRSFLSSEQVITFTDLDGRLLALKPDVTLSIAKTAQPAPGETLRYYYHENVYRPSAESHTFKEISQMGLELLGAVGEAEVQQAVCLAAQSLAALGAEWVLEVSHMGYLFGLFDALGVPEAARAQLLEKLRQKNAHELRAAALAAGLSETAADALCGVLELSGGYAATLSKAAALCRNPAMTAAVAELTALAPTLGQAGGSIRFEDQDLTRLSDKELRKICGNDISMIFQEPMTAMDPLMRIGPQVEEALAVHTQLTKEQRRARALEALRDIGDKFKADYLINVLTGKTTALIKSYGHNKSKWFGAGAEHDVRFWGAVLRQALILGLVDKNIENYGLISVNRKGENFIAMPFPVTVTLDHDYDEEEKEAEAVVPMGKGGAADEELFAMLKDLRKKVAKQHGLPPFVIFQDPSLEDMAVQYPITIEEMQNITGVGVGKARKFGEEFVKLIKAYVEEKEIIRPQDMIVKSVGNKSGNKIFIIQSIDRKMDFEDIARAKDLDFDELLTEIEGIVNSGTKLDISYYLRDFMDEDKIEDIYLYFKEDAESDSLDAAIDELGADYTEEEIRLVRIKFICEQGN